MNKPLIYLAGPIFQCTEGEAKDWRQYVSDELNRHGIVGVSPLRCEPLVGERYDTAYDDPCFGQPKSILAKNFLDLKRCDMTLAFFPPVTEPDELRGIATEFDYDGPHGYACPEKAATLRRIAAKGPQRSIGTIGEVSWAFALRKPCVIVSQDDLVKHHPFTAVQPDWPVLDTLDDAIRLIAGIYTVYAGA